jgi:polysaccharide biosynthesis protein PslH
LKILFLTQVLPYPLDAGPKVRAYYNLRHLTKAHEITLVSFVRPTDSESALDHLKDFCKEVITIPMKRSRAKDGVAMVKSLLTNVPFLITRDEVNAMTLRLRDIIRQRQFDAIHADQLWMAPYALSAREEARKCGYDPKIILDQHNAVFMIPRRMAASSGNPLLKIWLQRESRLMAGYEKWICEKFDRVVWVTKEDRSMVISQSQLLNDSGRNPVIPICFKPDHSHMPVDLTDTKNILFLGGLHWPPNAEGALWFANEILPLIVKYHAQARFLVVGKNPPAALQGRQDHIEAFGYVQNVDDIWAQSRVFIVPLRAGGGMRVKILDAWEKGMPIVSTTIGAEGIQYTDGTDILIADTPEDFAQAVQRILSDRELGMRLGLAGRATLENCYDWEKVYPAWEQVYSL